MSKLERHATHGTLPGQCAWLRACGGLQRPASDVRLTAQLGELAAAVVLAPSGGVHMDSPHPTEQAHAQETLSALRQALPRLNTSKAMQMWVEIRTFKALYSALRRVAGDIFLKYIDANTGNCELPNEVRQRIREKAVLSADKMLYYDTFDEAREYLVRNLEREICSTPAEVMSRETSPQTIVFPVQPKKGHQKQREMFGFLSDGDDDDGGDQQQQLRSERKKVAEMSEALTAWYGPGWEGELKRLKKERKARARDVEKEKERVEDEERRDRERRKKEEAFPGVPLYSEQDSLEKLKKRALSTEAQPAFPGIPLYNEHQRPRTDSRVGLSALVTKIDSAATVPQGITSPPSEPAAEEMPSAKRDKDSARDHKEKEKDRVASGVRDAPESPTMASSPPPRAPTKPTLAKSGTLGTASGSSTEDVTHSPSAESEQARGRALSSPSRGPASPPRGPPAKEEAFPGIPLHVITPMPSTARRNSQPKSPPSSGTGLLKDSSAQPRSPDSKK